MGEQQGLRIYACTTRAASIWSSSNFVRRCWLACEALIFTSYLLTCLTDRDGSVDMVFTTCSYVSSSSGVGSGCILNIAYNKQLPVCSSTTSSSVNKQGERICRSPVDLCIADPEFHYNLSKSPDNDVRVFSLVSDLTSFTDGLPRFIL